MGDQSQHAKIIGSILLDNCYVYVYVFVIGQHAGLQPKDTRWPSKKMPEGVAKRCQGVWQEDAKGSGNFLKLKTPAKRCRRVWQKDAKGSGNFMNSVRHLNLYCLTDSLTFNHGVSHRSSLSSRRSSLSNRNSIGDLLLSCQNVNAIRDFLVERIH